jgi:hypothetical protein
MATQLCQKCKQAHPGRVCDYDEKGECAETIGVNEEASMDGSPDKSKDQDRGKGAMEQDQQNRGGNTSMQGQLGHHDQGEELKDADSDLSG